MNQEASGEYLRNAVMTAGPEQLQLMLYDGAIRFTNQARDAIQSRDYETSCEKLLRAERIVQELEKGLRPEVNPELCGQMSSLYSFVYNRLVRANMTRDLTAIDEALQILNHMRETWILLIEKVREASPASAPVTARAAVRRQAPNPVAPSNTPQAIAETGSILSIEG
jgi:flagellar secretion chaperone FliS